MRYENNDLLREYLHRGAAGPHREHAKHPTFDLDAGAFAQTLAEVRQQHPHLSEPEADARAAFRLLTSGPLPALLQALPAAPHHSHAYFNGAYLTHIAPDAWRWAKIIWAISLLLLALTAVLLLTARQAHGATPPGSANLRIGVLSGRRAFTTFNRPVSEARTAPPHARPAVSAVTRASIARVTAARAPVSSTTATPTAHLRAPHTRANIVRPDDVSRALILQPPAFLPQIAGGGSVAARLQFLNGSSVWSSVGSGNPLPITCISGCSGGGSSTGTAVLSGQQAVTASAVALATNTTKTVCVKALAANTISVYVGASGVTTSTGMELAPGNAYCVAVTNTNLFYVIASATGASVSWAASN